MSNDDWRYPSNFPDAASDWSVFYPLLGLRREGEQLVHKQMKSALLTNPVLLSTPDTLGKCVPPILVDPQTIVARTTRDAGRMALYTAGLTMIGSVIFYFGTDLRGTIGYVSIMMTMIAYSAFNYMEFSKHPETLRERWLFYGWTMSRRPTYALTFALMMLIIGVCQLSANQIWSYDLVLDSAGLAFESVSEEGEFWRILTAPFLHKSADHWLINFVVGTGLLFVYGPVLRVRGVEAFLMAAPLSFAVVYVASAMGAIASEGIIGASGGVAGIVGYFLAENLKYPKRFPHRLYVTTLFVAASSLLVVSLVLSLTSFIAHFSGFLIGLTLGLIRN